MQLYLLLLHEKYRVDISRALLWYLHQPRPQLLYFDRGLLSSLLVKRSQLAKYLAWTPPAVANTEAEHTSPETSAIGAHTGEGLQQSGQQH